ncbi:hypothetical protein [Cryobacterium sp. PH31-O1]|uniref:hypothetical protein n=1 Tax=Cryobacterium sp. PH31-O1 TaxID=3046306 RepID=UPI0032D8C2C5
MATSSRTACSPSPRAFNPSLTRMALQRMLGHASAAMTLDVYANLFDDDLNSVAVALDQARMISNVGKMWAFGAPEAPITKLKPRSK